MAETEVFGREAEQTLIAKMLDEVTGGPVGLALEGSPGVGKTTVWRDAVASARERGYTVIASAPAEPDGALAFAGLGDLFDALPDDTLASVSVAERGALAARWSVATASRRPLTRWRSPVPS